MIKEYGYEYDAALDERLWKETARKVTSEKLFGAYCLRSGRDALKAIAREFSPRTVLLPALSCDSMVLPFELYGHKIQLYRLHSDYSVNLDSLKIGQEPTLLLYMNYFGRPAISDTSLEMLRARGNITFIEDRTHNLIWNRTSSFKPDYMMASLRKWLPIPDGGLLWGKINKPLSADTSFSSTRLKAQCMRHEFLIGGDEKIKTEYRKIFSTVSDIMDGDEPSAMSAYAYAKAAAADWEELRQIRSQNAKTLIEMLSSSPFITFIQDKPGRSDLYVPFTVPNRDEVQRRLSSMGIFNTVIWPLSIQQKAACQTAKFTEENMLAAPCDQRYTPDDMKYIGKEIVRTIANVNE